MGRHPTREIGEDHINSKSRRLEKRSTLRRLRQRTRSYNEEIKSRSTKPFGLEETQLTTGQHITLSTEFGKQLTRTILRLPSDQQFDKKLLLQ
eukprot:3635105-Amphidinium_carterae.1